MAMAREVLYFFLTGWGPEKKRGGKIIWVGAGGGIGWIKKGAYSNLERGGGGKARGVSNTSLLCGR